MAIGLTRRPRTHITGPRARQILVRVTEEAHAGLAIKAKSAGLSVSGLCERLVTQGKLEVIPAANAELHRKRPVSTAG